MLEADLFFGRDIAGRAPLTESEWRQFATRELTPRFPVGFTEIPAQGQWLSPTSGTIGREASFLVRIVAPETKEFLRDVQNAAAAYRNAYRQEAVGIVTSPVCGVF